MAKRLMAKREAMKISDKSKLKRKKNGKINEAITDKELSKKSKLDGSNTTEDTEESATEKGDENLDSKKPEQLSKRQMKKEKTKLREAQQMESSRQEAMKKALNYISMWKHARSNWKFEKLKQIWLMDNLLDENFVPDEIFSTVLEYFEGCKGMARETLLKKGMDVIKESEQKLENSDELVETVEYKRARLLLQALPTET